MVGDYLRHIRAFSPVARLFLGAQFLYHLGATVVWVLRNLHLRAAGWPAEAICYTMTFQALGMVAGILVLGRWMDRCRAWPFQVAGVLLMGAGMAGVALWPGGTPLVLALCLVTGMGMATFEVSTAPFYARHSEPQERPYLFGVGTALSPLAALAATLGIHAGSWAWGETLESYRRLMLGGAAAGTTATLLLLALREAEAPPGQEGRGRIDLSTAARFCVPEALFGLGAGLTIPFINLYFNVRFGVPAGTIGVYYAAAQGLMMVAFLLAPVVARRFGAVPTIVVFQLTSIPFFLVLALTSSLPLAVGAFILRHGCMNMVHPVSGHLSMVVAPPGQRTRLNGLKQMANKLSWVVATVAGGQILALSIDGFTVTMLITPVLYAAGSALYWRWFQGEPAGRVMPPEAEPAP